MFTCAAHPGASRLPGAVGTDDLRRVDATLALLSAISRKPLYQPVPSTIRGAHCTAAERELQRNRSKQRRDGVEPDQPI